MNKTRSLELISLIAVIVGFLAILGWLLHISILKSVVPGLPPMRFTPALVLISLGTSLFLLVHNKTLWVLRVLSSMVVIFSFASIFQDFTGIDLNIDEFFVKDTDAGPMGYHPGRPPVSGSVCFMLVAGAFLLFSSGNDKMISVGQYLLHVVTFISFIVILGYILNAPSLLNLYFFTSLALNMAVMLFAISIGSSLIYPDKGLTALFIGDSTGNVMARRMYPQIVGMLVIIAFIRLMIYRYGLVTEEQGIAMFTTLTMLVGLFLVSHNARKLNKTDEERKVAESTMHNLNRELERTVKNLEDYKFALDESSIVAIIDKNGIIQEVNDNACHVSKYSREELIGKNPSIYNSGYHSKEFFAGLWKTVTSGKIWKGEVRNKAKDGSIFWVDTTIIPFLDEDKEPVKYLVIRNDITERKQSQQKLRDSEEKYRHLFEEINESLIVQEAVTDSTGKITDLRFVEVNPQAEKFLQKSNSELAGRLRSEVLGPLDPEGAEIADRVINGKERIRRERYVAFMDKWFFVDSYSPKPGQIATMNLDITELKKSQEFLNNINTELEKKVQERTVELAGALEREKSINEMKSRFVSMASHEFRTPLSSLLTSVDLLQRYTQPQQGSREAKHFNRIRSSVDNLVEILNDFLSLDKLESGKIKPDYVEFNAKETADAVVEEMKELRKKEQEIIYTYGGSETIIQDQKIFRNTLYNLLSNAIKYSDDDKKINLDIQSAEGAVSVVVEDHGMGIPEEEQKFMFSRLFRAKNVANISGTGLGLNIVKRYLELVGGTIAFESETGKGTKFFVRMPEPSKP